MSVTGPGQAPRPEQVLAPPPPPPPPPPQLSPVERGDVAAGRLRPVEGQLFSVPPAGTRNDAPATASWGAEAAGSPYRQAFDQVAARLGTNDPATVGAEIDRQLYGAAPPAPAPAAPTQASSEGVGSFVEGAVKGDFGNNTSWSATAGQVAVGFVPIVGQVADARDTIASAGQVLRGEEGGWLNLGAAVVGWVPGVGDAAKAAIRGGDRIADAGGEVTQGAVRQANVPPTGRVAEAAQRAGIDEATAQRVVETPKGQRPDPTTYMSAEQIERHLAPYRESGAVRFTSSASIERYHTLGPADGGFTMPRSELDALLVETGGDMAQIETRLGLDAGSFTNGEFVAAYIKPEELRGLRVPSGNEAGANSQWLPGGLTSGGFSEAVVDLPAEVRYTEITFGD